MSIDDKLKTLPIAWCSLVKIKVINKESTDGDGEVFRGLAHPYFGSLVVGEIITSKVKNLRQVSPNSWIIKTKNSIYRLTLL